MMLIARLKSGLIFLLFFCSGIVQTSGQDQGTIKIPTDTLGKEFYGELWAFWDQDLEKERFSKNPPSGKMLKLPIDRVDLRDVEAKGIGWLGKRIYVPDSMLGRYKIELTQFGASEIYIDGNRIGSIGKLGKDRSEEKRRYTRRFSPYQHVFKEKGTHLLLLRFSDRTWQEEQDKYGVRRNYGVKDLAIKPLTEDSGSSRVLLTSGIASLAGVFLGLGFIHLLIFLFYPRKRSNLYYTLFIWGLAVIFLFFVFFIWTENTISRLYYGLYAKYLLYVVGFGLLSMIYALLSPKGLGRTYWVVLLGGIGFVFLNDIEVIPLHWSFSFLVLGIILIDSLRVIIKSMVRRQKGAWILGIGGAVFAAYPLYLVFESFFTSSKVGVQMDNIYDAIWLISLPLSMSIYLARDFAETNKGLERKLEEVEELNEKNLEQEREKQRILEEKKEELEEKVEERTAELKERKEEIEDAHREITDSINYAQRIQEAVLPEEEHYAPLPEHFILFKPRDPVSGDFHWGKQEGEHFYLAAVDCTGHGVPGGFMSMLGVSFLNEIMGNVSGLHPGELLSRLKERVVEELSSGKERGTKDGMDAALFRLGPEEKDGSREVEFAGAQNPLYLIRSGIAQDPPGFEVQRGGDRVDESPWKAFRDTSDGLEIKGDKGGIGKDASGIDTFRTVRFKAQKGDELFIFSDGYADQFGGEKGKKFRYGAFKRLLISLHGKPMAEEKEVLERSFEDWKREREQVDDVLVIGLRI